jgi:hypothetical protein
MYDKSPLAIDTSKSWIAAELADEVRSGDAKAIAYRLGGIVANDDRIVAAIQTALNGRHDSDETAAVLLAVAHALSP